MIRRYAILISTVLLFAALCLWWMGRAGNLPLENDELYSLTSSIEKTSYVQMVLGHIDEGSNAPLFYAVQKLILQSAHYQSPIEWRKGQWGFRQHQGNVLLRIFPVLCMAVGVVLIFYYFAMHWHVLLGIYATLISLTSYMVLTYVCQSRPYALWFFLTVVQLVLVLCILALDQRQQRRYFKGLVAVHFLLAFTVIFSVIQNAAVCLVLWFFVKKDWKTMAILLLGPLAIAVFYFMHAPHYHFWFAESFLKLLGASLPLDRMGIILLGILALALSNVSWFKRWFASVPKAQVKVAKGMLVAGAVVYAGCIAVLYKFKMGQSAYMDGFQVSNRYFMVLAPTGIFMVAIMSYYLATIPKGVVKSAAWILLGVLLAFRFIRTLL